ncbi:MAG: polyprenyl synthetase family protein [Balneolia bacterium]|nr:polyprenyl synthetase family protein [Balneolia bacterium]
MSEFKNPAELAKLAIEQIHIPERPKSLYDPVRYTMALGGKRVRPQLVFLGTGMTGGDPEKALNAAAAVELLHNFTLIHDDIMDQADSRRGQPSVHTRWDEATAILSGDVMFNMAYEQLAHYRPEHGFDSGLFLALNEVFSDATRIVCEGQAMDMEFETALTVELSHYIEMISCKTAALLEASLKMGGLLSGADSMAVEKLGIVGRQAGVAFQIQDDLLDAIADPKTFGKRPGGDIYEGKKTYLSILALDRARKDVRQKLSAILQNSACTESDVSYVIDAYHDLNVIIDTKEAIKNHYIACLSALEYFGDSSYKKAISDLIESLKERQS